MVPLAVAAAGSLALGGGAAEALRAHHGKDTGWTFLHDDGVAVQDNESDGNSVEIQYQRRGSPGTTRHLWNHSGAGTTAYSARASTVFKIRICEERDWAPDSCASWVA
ncbi:hypothetical protein GCM10022402_33260 [Salinactinospora qingdaonensis]|uniref:Secreted protein n=1 Tax=Salinactinospora qingdaonensis TaxID=702744 RepID=A0ABP7G4U2_9ACTN